MKTNMWIHRESVSVAFCFQKMYSGTNLPPIHYHIIAAESQSSPPERTLEAFPKAKNSKSNLLQLKESFGLIQKKHGNGQTVKLFHSPSFNMLNTQKHMDDLNLKNDRNLIFLREKSAISRCFHTVKPWEVGNFSC